MVLSTFTDLQASLVFLLASPDGADGLGDKLAQEASGYRSIHLSQKVFINNIQVSRT